MKKRIAAVLMCVCLLLSGCASLREENDISDLPGLDVQHSDIGDPSRMITPSLYFLDASQTRLVTETRELTVYAGDREADVLLTALFAGPVSSELRSLGSGLSLDYVEITGEISNVYILSDRTYGDERRFMIAAAVADTMIDYYGVSYVSVFINGEGLTVNGYPCALMTRTLASVQDAYNEYVLKYSAQYYLDGEEYELSVVLYFPDETGNYILPEVRKISIAFSDDMAQFRKELVCKLLEELARGPKSRDDAVVCVTKAASLPDSLNISFDSTVRTLALSFYTYPFLHKPEDTGGMDELSSASLFYTLSGALGGTIRVSLKYGVREKSLSRVLAKIYLGSTITIYLPKEGMTSLSAVTRTVYAGKYYLPETYITELMKRPLSVDAEGIKGAFPEEMEKTSVFRSVEIRGGIAFVDFTSDFAIAAEKLSDSEERMMVYSIVNTLCGISRIKSVQFLIDGEYASDVGGVIHLEYPLLPDPGLLG